LSGAADRFARVTELATGRVTRAFEGHTHHVMGVSWRRDGRALVTAGADNSVKSWDFTTGERRKNIAGFGKEVTAIRHLGVADRHLACGADGQLRAAKADGGDAKALATPPDCLQSLAITEDGRVAVTGSLEGHLRVWRTEDGKETARFGP
jgi:WD40 repeat protein